MNNKILAQALNKIAKAYLFIYLNFNLNFGSVSINFIPSWLGYLWIHQTIQTLKEKQKTLTLLEPLCFALMIYHGIDWCLNILGLSFHSDIISLFSEIISLYFHFQFLTDLAEITASYECPSTQKLLQLRTIRTVLLTIPALPLPWKQITWSIILIVLIYIIVIVATCSTLFTLENELKEKEVLY
ncbi:MAG: hypothetical protein IJ356_00845 [Erysipelotrichaceae bacterium]|nr:hypothetical protein [Erysipelotrichaceae bacterium]